MTELTYFAHRINSPKQYAKQSLISLWVILQSSVKILHYTINQKTLKWPKWSNQNDDQKDLLCMLKWLIKIDQLKRESNG